MGNVYFTSDRIFYLSVSSFLKCLFGCIVCCSYLSSCLHFSVLTRTGDKSSTTVSQLSVVPDCVFFLDIHITKTAEQNYFICLTYVFVKE